MTEIAVAGLVCGTAIQCLVLVLRFLEKRDAAKSAVVADSVAVELREALKKAEDRLSKLEMKAAFR